MTFKSYYMRRAWKKAIDLASKEYMKRVSEGLRGLQYSTIPISMFASVQPIDDPGVCKEFKRINHEEES